MAARPEAPASRAGRGIFQRDSPNGQHRNAQGAANFCQASETLRGAKLHFRGSGKHGTEDDVVRAVVLCGARSFERMARRADQEARGRARLPQPLFLPSYDVGDGEGFTAQVDPCGACRERDVQAVVHENPSGRGPHSGAGEREERARREILLAKLDPIEAGGRGRSDALEQGASRGLVRAGRQAVAVGDVTQQRLRCAAQRRTEGAGEACRPPG